jgi:glutamine synthetase
MGEYISQRFIKAKEKEWERYQYQVHPWELDEYLTAF